MDVQSAIGALSNLESHMNLSTIPVRPFVEGIIRIATKTQPGVDRITFDGTMEVLARNHQKREPDQIEIPHLEQHAIGKSLMEQSKNKEAGKLVEIPIRMFFGKAANALTAAFQAYDADGKPICRGNGDKARRTSVSDDGIHAVVDVPCAGPSNCPLVTSGQARCQRQVCLTVQIEGQENPLSTFEVRSSSYNTFKTIKGQLELIERRFGGLRHVPLKLQLWQTSNQASAYEAFDVFKLALGATSEIDAMKAAKEARQAEVDAGLVEDVDAAYSSGPEGVGDDDFELVTDFYAPRSGAGRRNGAGSVVAQLVGKGQEGGASLASNVIAQAMAMAGDGAGLEKAQSTGAEITA
jgi:hypothetical protein